MNGSIVNASEYLKQFPTPIISIIAKFISFVSGGFSAIMIIITFLEESLLEGHIFGRTLFWYAAVFGTITASSWAAVTVIDEFLVLDPNGAMSLVVQHTHYMPKRWRGKEKTDCPIFKIMVIAIMVHLIYHTSPAWRSSRGKMDKSFLRSSALQRDDIVWNRYMRV
ncbi:autophagy-related protein 9-like [Euphorbia lathyris]